MKTNNYYFKPHIGIFIISYIISILIVILYYYYSNKSLEAIHYSIFTVVTFLVATFAALTIDIKQNKKNFQNRNYTLSNILTKTYNFSKYSPFVSIFYSLTFIFIFLLIILVFFNGTDIAKDSNLAGYIVGIIASTIVGIWSLFMTFVIRHQQKNDFSGMDVFLWDIGDIFHEWHDKDPIRGEYAPKKRRPKKELYLLDYHPLIGSISEDHGTSQPYKNYKFGLERISQCKDVDIRIICFDDDNMLNLIKSMKPSLKGESSTFANFLDLNLFDEELIGYCKKYELKSENITIWHTSKINPLHFIIADNKIFQYSVIPIENNNGRNILKGYISQDVFQIEFLKSTFQAVEKFAVTPKLTINKHSVLFQFEKQINIKYIQFLDNRHNELYKLEYSVNNEDIMQDFIIENKEQINNEVLSNIEIKNEVLIDKIYNKWLENTKNNLKNDDFFFRVLLIKSIKANTSVIKKSEESERIKLNVKYLIEQIETN